MSEQQDYYELLGVRPTASHSEIKEAFRRLAQQYHPDRGSISPENVELFKRITEAYRTLANAEARNAYNKEHGFRFHEEVKIGGVGVREQEAAAEEQVEIASVDRDLNALHKMAGSKGDLRAQQLQAVDPSELDDTLEQPEEIAAWGDLDTAPVGGGILSNLLSGRRKDKANQKRSALKKNLKRTMQQESIPKRPSKINEIEPNVSRNRSSEEYDAPGFENPLQSERYFRFQITSLEAALGTSREAVLSAGGSDRISKLPIEIPAGTEHGTVLEVARGWERARAEISVVQDPLVEVRGVDLHFRAPITLKEALEAASFMVPGINQQFSVQLHSGADALARIEVAEAGISRDGIRGSLFVYPYIVAPMQNSTTLEAAVQFIDSHYSEGDVRREFLARPLSEEFCIEDHSQISFFVPIKFGEALSGVTVNLDVRGTNVSLRIPQRWDYRKELFIGDYMSSLGKLIRIQPQIALPDKFSPELQGAALAVEQHFLESPRSQLPRRLMRSEKPKP